MFHKSCRKAPVAAAAFVIAASLSSQAAAETLLGTDIESRVIIGLAASPEAIGDMLPEGWMPIAFPSGPLKGANFLVSFIDGHAAIGPDGKPASPNARRAVSLVSLAKQVDGDGVRLYLTGVLAAGAEEDLYSVKDAADISRSYYLGGPAAGGRQVVDDWSVSVETGGTLTLELEFTTGTRGWGQSVSTLHSTGDPDFLTTYRWDSLTDVVMSDAMGKPINGSIALSSTIPSLAPVFDGNEQIKAVLDIPVRIRTSYSQ